MSAAENLGLSGLATVLALGLLAAPATAEPRQAPQKTAPRTTQHQAAQQQAAEPIKKVSYAGLQGHARNAAWSGNDGWGGWCFVGEGVYNPAAGMRVFNYCAGEFNSLISYRLEGDQRMHYQTAGAWTCQPFDDSHTIYEVKRHR